MDPSITDRLQNLKAVLYKVMGHDSITGAQYTDALECAIEFIHNSRLSIETPVYRVVAESTPDGGIILDVYTSEDEHLQTIAFDPDDIITDDILGES
tara:strand:- start:6529 stop:6819 length:291 start_codon:yes stop_codon:yes gene_type:complete